MIQLKTSLWDQIILQFPHKQNYLFKQGWQGSRGSKTMHLVLTSINNVKNSAGKKQCSLCN